MALTPTTAAAETATFVVAAVATTGVAMATEVAEGLEALAMEATKAVVATEAEAEEDNNCCHCSCSVSSSSSSSSS